MAKGNQRSIEELLIDLMIVQMAIAGAGNAAIRAVTGVDNNRVSRIARHLRKKDAA